MLAPILPMCGRVCNIPHMATNLDLDPKLVEEAKKLGKHRTKREAVTTALREYVNAKQRLAILELAGTIDWDPDYDYKAMRSRKPASSKAKRQA